MVVVMKTYGIDNAKGVVKKGNWYRIKKVMRKAAKGEAVTIGFLGGSITQGCLSSAPETCYAYLVYAWWKKTFPDSNVSYVNAGIGGTTSQFGAARADSDLLSHEIDFTVVEFSVNDDNNEHFQETYEGLIRHIYASDTKPAVLIVNNVRYDDGSNAEEQHNRIGEAYQIPCVSMKPTIYARVAGGSITSREITADDLHPNDTGHALVAEVIICFLEQVYQDLTNENEREQQMPAPITQNAYEHSKKYQNDNSNPICRGFVRDCTPKKDIREIFRNGWTAGKEGDAITFTVTGTCIAVQYRKSVIQPTPIARAIVDDDVEHAVLLDGNFEETWGDSIHIDTVAEHLPEGRHTVKIELITTHEEDKVPFYLVSVIAS